MCCAVCPKFPCRASISLRTHNARHSGMPAPHFHFCKGVAPCALDCRSCNFRIKEVAHAPAGHYEYGCCHLCPAYGECRDFVQKHVAAAPRYTRAPPRRQDAAQAQCEHGL